MIARGTTLTIVVTGQDSFWSLDTSSISSRVGVVLASFPLRLQAVVLDTAGFFSSAQVTAFLSGLYDYRATFTVETLQDYFDKTAVEADLWAAIVAGTGRAPATIATTTIAGVSTGATGGPAPTAEIDPGAVVGQAGRSLTDIFQATPWVIVGALGVLAIAVVVIARNPASLRAVRG